MPAASALPDARRADHHRHRALRLRALDLAIPRDRAHGRHVQRAGRQRVSHGGAARGGRGDRHRVRPVPYRAGRPRALRSNPAACGGRPGPAARALAERGRGTRAPDARSNRRERRGDHAALRGAAPHRGQDATGGAGIAMACVTLERRGPIGIVTLGRPERLNAMSRALTRETEAAFRQANADPEIAVIVFTGAGRAFCAGDDLKEFGEQSASPAAIADHVGGIQAVTRAMALSDKVIVGAIHGYAVGGGFEWLCNCDMVVAADDLVAFFPEMDLGQFVTGALTHLLPQAVGYQRAMRLMVLGERQSARDLEALGLVGWVVPRDAMLPKALEIAGKVVEQSRYSVGKLKRLLVAGLDDRLERALRLEGEI